MTYKTIPTMNKKNHDDFSISGNIITINDTDYDLENPQVLQEIGKDEEDNPILESYENQRVYLENDICYVRLIVDFLQFHLFANSGYLIFHDKDSNGELDLLEYMNFLGCLLNSDSERREEHRQVITEFCLKSVSEKNPDKAREFYNSRTPGTLRANYTRTLKQFIADNKLDEVFKAEVMSGYEAWLKHVKDCMEVK